MLRTVDTNLTNREKNKKDTEELKSYFQQKMADLKIK